MLPYPLNYFLSIFSFQRAFSHRKLLSWIQLIFTSIFLISLSLIPLALQNGQLQTYPLDTFIENVYSPLSEEAIAALENVSLENNSLSYTGAQAEFSNTDGLVLIGHQESLSNSPNLILYFDKDFLQISKEGNELASISYRHLSQEDFQSKKKLTEALSRNWYQENQVAINLFLILTASFLLGLNFFIITLGASFFLYLTKKSALFSFTTFKECFHFTLNCLGLPTLISVLAGLLGQPLSTMITLQNILFVLFIAIVFYRTHFRDASYYEE